MVVLDTFRDNLCLWCYTAVHLGVRVEKKNFHENLPHVILYDIEAIGEKNQQKEPTAALLFENAHMPISGVH